MSSVPSVIVNGLRRSFRLSDGTTIDVLRGLDLQVRSGEFVTIMGPSGCGKSTLLNILGSLLPADDGSVTIQGRELVNVKKREQVEFRRSLTGMIFQDFNLVTYLDARSNVALPFVLKGGEEEEALVLADKLLSKLEIGDRSSYLAEDMSGGQQQRVAIARALINDPPVLLADEPTGNLDRKTGQEVIGLLRELAHEEGKTCIVVSHDTELARLADRIFVLRDGVLKEEMEAAA